MVTPNRREVLQQVLTGLFQAAGAATVILVSGSVRAGTPTHVGDDTPLPVQDETQPQPTLEERAEQAVANQAELPPETQDENTFVNGAFRNGGFVNGSFRNGGFANGGGFRNSAFANGGGGGGGAFRNGAFRNF